ncbi:MAG: Phosphate butyryltransferase [Sporomusa sp.]|jgi:phosphate butyryltransferase|nr:Phosphate butyryltransferase [Sporomusa sp.]
MLRNFMEVLDKAKQAGRQIISVAAAQDKDVLKAVKAAWDAGLAQAILVGDADLIRPLLGEVGLPSDMPIVHEPEVSKAAMTAVSLVKNGKAQIFMKGLVNSSDFLKAVVNKELGLRTGHLLSHLSAYEVPGGEKLIFLTDSGMNVAPSQEEKKGILVNAIMAISALGIERPKVAVLAASEIVNPKIQATVDAKALADMYIQGEFYPAIVEGPIAMDVALSPEHAKHKGITSEIAGNVDIFMIPNIEAGNILSKALIHYANFKNAGVIIGATHPVVMVSRADSAEAKLYSIALACLLAGAKQ